MFPFSQKNSSEQDGRTVGAKSVQDAIHQEGVDIPYPVIYSPANQGYGTQLKIDNIVEQSKKQKSTKTRFPPQELETSGPESNKAFEIAINDSSNTISPLRYGFIPKNYWLSMDVTFGDLVAKFFKRKNNANCRFPHKLYNALKIVEKDPSKYPLVGVCWVTSVYFKVDKFIFARLLGISSVDGGLFHQQGNFTSHGFAELPLFEARTIKSQTPIDDVDSVRVKIMYHTNKVFTMECSEDIIDQCKWTAK